jgi:hypothetical protein
VETALADDAGFARGLNTRAGSLTHEAVAAAFAWPAGNHPLIQTSANDQRHTPDKRQGARR